MWLNEVITPPPAGTAYDGWSAAVAVWTLSWSGKSPITGTKVWPMVVAALALAAQSMVTASAAVMARMI
jgi:hypothetical protein